MRKIKQADRPYRIIRHRLGQAPWTYDCRQTRQAAETIAAQLRLKHPRERVEVAFSLQER